LSTTRRAFAMGSAALLGGCVSQYRPPTARRIFPGVAAREDIYGEVEDDGYGIPAVEISQIEPAYMRQTVAYSGGEPPGTVIVDPKNCFLHHVGAHGRATRYGVGVGRQGFGWSGIAAVRRKAEWPTWTPPPDMIARQPELEEYALGMPGGLDNPLGARAMYLYQGSRDTLYRLHGTNEPDSIGKHVSSGCIRLINQDIVDLYDRVSIGTKVVVLSNRVS
jgi:lipoprotein-anchoring transpeptidase ErfK/SrfK